MIGFCKWWYEIQNHPKYEADKWFDRSFLDKHVQQEFSV